MTVHQPNANQTPAALSNLPLESRAARKKRRKRERLAAEAEGYTKASIPAKAFSGRAAPQTFQIPTIAFASTSLSASRPTRPLPHVLPSRRPSLPLPAKPSTSLPPTLHLPSDSIASSMISSAIPIPALSAAFSTSISPLHSLPPITAPVPPISPYTAPFSAPLPSKPHEPLLPPPALPADPLPNVAQPLPSIVPKKQIGMSSETDPQGRHGVFVLPKGSPLPDPIKTLVMELMPKKFRTPIFVRKWAMSFGSHPRGSPPRIDVDARMGKALIEFANRELAALGWASPRLPIGEGKEHIRVWWYRPVWGADRPELEEGEIEESVVGPPPPASSKKDKGKGKQKEAKPQQNLRPSFNAEPSKDTSFPHSTVYNIPPTESTLRDIMEAPPPQTGSTASIGAAWLDSQAFPTSTPAVPPARLAYGDTEEAMDLGSEDDLVGYTQAPFETQDKSESESGFPGIGIATSLTGSLTMGTPLDQYKHINQDGKYLLTLPGTSTPSTGDSSPSLPFSGTAPSTRKLNVSPSSVPSRDLEGECQSPSLVESVTSIPPSEIFSSVASSISSLPSIVTPPPSTPVDTPLLVSRSRLRTPTPPTESRLDQKTSNNHLKPSQVTLQRREVIEERLARSREELAARRTNSLTETPAQVDLPNSKTAPSLLPRSSSPVSIFPRDATEESLRRKVLASKRSRTMSTPVCSPGDRPPSSELNSVTSSASISSTPTQATSNNSSSTSIVTSTSSSTMTLSSTTHLLSSLSVTQSAVNFEALADSFISETIRTVAPRSSSSPTSSRPSTSVSSTSMSRMLSEKEILAKKQKLLEQHISDTKSLIKQISTAVSKVEKTDLRNQLKESTRFVGIFLFLFLFQYFRG